MSLQQGGNSNMFVMDLRSKNHAPDRYAGDRHVAILCAGWQPDCFESDRGGKADLCDGRTAAAAHRISFGEGSYSTPVWSPRGDYIAFTKQAAGSSPSA